LFGFFCLEEQLGVVISNLGQSEICGLIDEDNWEVISDVDDSILIKWSLPKGGPRGLARNHGKLEGLVRNEKSKVEILRVITRMNLVNQAPIADFVIPVVRDDKGHEVARVFELITLFIRKRLGLNTNEEGRVELDNLLNRLSHLFVDYFLNFFIFSFLNFYGK
jgi:hypothetical protein